MKTAPSRGMAATVLTGRADPRSLRNAPGLYVAADSAQAFLVLRAMTLVGWAKLEGRRYLPDGRAVIVVRVPGAERRTNPSITIGREFFVTALKDYENWREKWWREAVQNAVDAKAKHVALTAAENADETWTVACEDDGGGMTEEVLLTKFLVLGGTTKTSESGTAGGFGKAKELLVLPWIRWSVHTRDVLVEGAGIEYTVRKAPYLSGTKLTAVMPADQYTYEAPAVAFLSKCDIPGVKFAVNGKVVAANLRAKRVIDTIKDDDGSDIAAVTFIEGDLKSIIVRTHGLFMFDRYLTSTAPGAVLVDLLKPSIELLTANRDGFRLYKLRAAIDDLANRLASDVMSAVRDKQGMIRKRFTGSGKFKVEERAAEVLINVGSAVGDLHGELPSGAIKILEEMSDHYRRDDSGDPAEDPGGVIGALTGATARALLEMKVGGHDHLAAMVGQMVWRPDFYLINEIEGYKIPKKFFPATMTPTVLKLAKVWTELCRYVLMQLGSTARYGVGFVISPFARAMHVLDKEEHWLLLNPFRRAGTTTGKLLSPTDDDLKWIYAAAIHECTHLADHITYHDEAFAAALTHNMAKCADGYRQIKKIVASIKMRGSAEADD